MKITNAPIRILIIDDDEEDYLITSEYIKLIPGRHFIIDWCFDFQEAIDRICHGKYDLYFVDYLMAPRTGLELIQEAAKNSCEEPIILLTGGREITR